MSKRIFFKSRWQYDTDCRLQRLRSVLGLVIAPTLPSEQPYYLGLTGGEGGSHSFGGGTPGAFGTKCYLRKAIQWCRKMRRRLIGKDSPRCRF